MFQLQTPNIGFKHLDICSNGYWGSKVTKGHSRSPGVTKCKKENNCNTSYIFKLKENLKHVALSYYPGKSSDHVIFYISGFHGYLFLA